MTKPCLQLEQSHRLLGVVELRGDGRASPVAGDASTRVLSWHTGFVAERRNQRRVQIAWWYRTSAEAEQKRNGLGGLGVDVEGLRRTLCLPGCDRVTDQRIHRLGVARTSLVRWHVQQAGSVVAW